MIELDPAAALEELSDETLYPQLDDKRRGELTEIAGRRAEQARIDEETTRVRDDRETAAAKAEAARVFATGFGAKLRQGAATAVEIGVAEADGVIDRADADRLVQRLKDDEAARSERARLGDIARSALVCPASILPKNAPTWRVLPPRAVILLTRQAARRAESRE